MARYKVLMTFEAPGLTAALERRHSAPGATIRLLASDGRLAVSATGVRADTPSEAAVRVTEELGRIWGKSAGPLKMASWRAERERVLAGMIGARRSAVTGQGPWPDGFGEGGTAGVREPRRPKPGPGSMSMRADLP